jgi:predicted transcriptional regulator of viral defense system
MEMMQDPDALQTCTPGHIGLNPNYVVWKQTAINDPVPGPPARNWCGKPYKCWVTNHIIFDMIGGMMEKELVRALRRYPVFSVRDIAGVLNKGRNYAYLVAYRLKKNGAINEIEKGKYSLDSDPFLVASWVVWPSYISGWAALNYYNLTEQLPFTIHVMTTRKRKRKIISYGNAKIEFVKIKNSAFTGFQRIPYQGKEIFIAEKEKAIIDGLATKKMSFGEAIELIRINRGKISSRKLFSYARAWTGLAKRLKAMLDD